MMTRHKPVPDFLSVLSSTGFILSLSVQFQNLPKKNIRIIIPFYIPPCLITQSFSQCTILQQIVNRIRQLRRVPRLNQETIPSILDHILVPRNPCCQHTFAISHSLEQCQRHTLPKRRQHKYIRRHIRRSEFSLGKVPEEENIALSS